MLNKEVPTQKKILILIEWFKPGFKAGGPIQSNINICKALSKQYQIYVFTTNTDHGEIIPYQSIPSNKWITDKDLGVQVYYANKATINKKQLLDIINSVQPNFIYINLLFSPIFAIYPIYVAFIKKLPASIIVAPRGTLYNSAISLKWYFKKPLLFLYKALGVPKKITFHATNEREALAIETYFPKSNTIVANNLPNLQQTPFCSTQKKVGELKCIFIGRIVPIKNLLFLLEVLHKVKSKIVLTIVGPIEDESYWLQCKKMMEILPNNIQSNYVGAIINKDLDNLLTNNHLMVLPTTGENFGHAIFESFLQGRPVLISDQTPWLHLQSQQAGWDVPLQLENRFVEIIEECSNYTQQQFDTIAIGAWQYAHTFINNPLLLQKYTQLFS